MNVESTIEPYDIALPLLYTDDPPEFIAELLEIGASMGDALATYSFATQLLHGNKELRIRRDVPRGMRILRKAAKTFPRAMYDLAVSYAEGLGGLRRNEMRAFTLYQQAASGGHLGALFEVARRLEFGEGVKRNHRQALVLLKRAESILNKIERLQIAKS
jgi:TPR repeat protein